MPTFLTIWLIISFILGFGLTFWFERLAFGTMLSAKDDLFKVLPILVICIIAWPIMLIILLIWQFKNEEKTQSVEKDLTGKPVLRGHRLESAENYKIARKIETLEKIHREPSDDLESAYIRFFLKASLSPKYYMWDTPRQEFIKQKFKNNGNETQITREYMKTFGKSKITKYDRFAIKLLIQTASFKYVIESPSLRVPYKDKSFLINRYELALEVFKECGIEILWNEKMPIITKYNWASVLIDPNINR